MVEMDAWSRILLKNSVSYSKFVSARTEWEGVNQMWAGVDTGGVGEGGGQSLVKMCWHPFRLALSFSHGDIMLVNRSNN